MPPRQKLSDVNRGRAIAWVQDGVSLRQVATRLRVSVSVISRLIQRVNATGSAQERPRSGRPANRIRTRLRAATRVNISCQTVRRRLHEFGLNARRPAVRQRLTPAHKAARLAFCRRHVRWTRQQWANVLFSDESRFSLHHNDGRIRVWRRPGERLLDAAVREVVPFGGGSVMVWGAFSLNHRTPLGATRGVPG